MSCELEEREVFWAEGDDEEVGVILIVESDRVLAKCLGWMCEKRGRVEMAKNVTEAWWILNEMRVEMVFLEMRLEGGSGMELVHEMMSYEEVRRIPIVMLMEGRGIGEEMAECGVVRVLGWEEVTPEVVWGLCERYGGGRKLELDEMRRSGLRRGHLCGSYGSGGLEKGRVGGRAGVKDEGFVEERLGRARGSER